MFSRCGKGPHYQVLRELNAENSVDWIYNDPAAEIKYNNNKLQLPLFFSKPKNIRRVLNFLEVSSGELDKVFKMFTTLLSIKESEIKDFDRIDLKSWVSSYTDNLSVHDFLNSICILYFALPYYRASAGEFIYCFKNMFLDSSFGYVKGGSASISKAFVNAACGYNAEIRTDVEVKKILVENDRVVGVELVDGNTIESNLVISNSGIKETVLYLVGEKHFSNEYVKYIKNLKESLGYLSIKVALKKPITEKPCHVVMPLHSEESFKEIDSEKPPKDMFLFIPVASNLDPQMAPNGSQLLIFGTPCSENPNINYNPWIKRLKENICELFPNIFDEALWFDITTPNDIANWIGKVNGCAIGLAQSPNQSGDNRPESASPIEGLYYVGADVRGRGIGTELASDSALRLAECLKSFF